MRKDSKRRDAFLFPRATLLSHGLDLHADATSGRARVMLRSFSFHEFLLLHSPILKPDFDLALGQVEHVGEFDAAFARDVRVHDELALEPTRLRARVRHALFPSAGGEFDDRRPVLVRVVVGERVSQSRDVRRQDGRGHAAGGQGRWLRQTWK